MLTIAKLRGNLRRCEINSESADLDSARRAFPRRAAAAYCHGHDLSPGSESGPSRVCYSADSDLDSEVADSESVTQWARGHEGQRKRPSKCRPQQVKWT